MIIHVVRTCSRKSSSELRFLLSSSFLVQEDSEEWVLLRIYQTPMQSRSSCSIPPTLLIVLWLH